MSSQLLCVVIQFRRLHSPHHLPSLTRVYQNIYEQALSTLEKGACATVSHWSVSE